MDYPLIERHLTGDEAATQELRGEIRTLAMRILAHSAYDIPTAAERRKLATQIENEVLELGGTLPAHFVNSALLIANRTGLQRKRTAQGDPEGHLAPQLIATYALRPTELAAPDRKAMAHHLSECAYCQGDVERAKVATRETMAPPTAPKPVEDPFAVNREEDKDADVAIEAAAEAALRELTTTPKAPAKTPKSPRRKRSVHSARRRPSPPEESTSNRWMWVLGLIAVGAFFWAQKDAVHTGGKMLKNPALAQLASVNVPRNLSFDGLPTDAEGPYEDLVNGDCETAAARFRTSRKRHPTVGKVWLFEGISALCAGDHQTAATALDEARNLMPTSEPAWWRAQAALVAGDERAATEALEWVAEYDVTKRTEANALIRSIASQRP